jgi:D-3-phosphoglycerate dehydrogenase
MAEGSTRWNVLVSDPVAEEGLELLRVEPRVHLTLETKHTPQELLEAVREADALVVRSQTRVTADVLEAAQRLRVVARAGVGVDNIDVPAATRRGVLVLNSPEGNTIAATELAIALLLALSRNLPQAHASLSAGEWRRGDFAGVEVYNKVLGIIGLGKIGSEVARRVRALGMQVVAFDPYISLEHAERIGVGLVELDRLLSESDYITVHVPLTKETRHLIGQQELSKAKDRVRIINTARGGIIDEQALADAVKSGKVAGAAIDVFEKEPPVDSPLVGLPGVIVTPHLGASTEEAQVKVAVDVISQVLDVLDGRPPRTAVNVPAVSPDTLDLLRPYLHLAEKMGRLLAQLYEGRLTAVNISYAGEVAELDVQPLSRAVLAGLLSPVLGESVNYVNAPLLAESRGVRVQETKATAPTDYVSLLTVSVSTDAEKREVAGTVFGRHDVRILRLDGYRVDLEPSGLMLISGHIDRPGVIGKVGTILGDSGINIAGMQVGRDVPRGHAVMILSVDSPIPPELIAKISQVEGMEQAKLVEL